MLYEKEMVICWAYISKYNSTREKQILNNIKCRKRSLALSWSKKLSALLHGTTSKYKINCLHSFRTENT